MRPRRGNVWAGAEHGRTRFPVSKTEQSGHRTQLTESEYASLLGKARTVCVAAKVGLADQLASGPKSALELAGPMQAHAPSLHRLMRTLASLGILTEQRDSVLR
ncbi:methyltransferase family protein [Bradyrhizobium sp. Pa8]|uniref:methyltransferase family protein n=1 Tax=Bradyrhizobium sp. Pa8 TaxID=3386552 RepID=UPI00403F2CFB